MCQVNARNRGRCYYRFTTLERKRYRVCAFCGHRSPARARRRCPELAMPAPNWFASLTRPATDSEYKRRARELRIQTGVGAGNQGFS